MNFDELLEYAPLSGAHVALVAAAAACLAVLTVWWALLDRTPVQRRIGALAGRREALKSDLLAPRRRPQAASQGVGVARKIVEKLKLMRGKTAALAAKKLVRAGFRSNDAVALYLFAKLCLPLCFGLAAAFIFYGIDYMSLDPDLKPFAAIGAVLAGFYAPEMFVRNATERRRANLVRALPDALDLMVICTEAGSSMDATFARVAEEMRQSTPEMAEEIELTGIELGFLPDRRQALENLSERTGIKHVEALVSTLIQTEKYGTPLAESLRILARELRDERLMKAEAKAARLPATLMVPMVLFILPVLFIVLIGPGALKILDGLGDYF